MRAASSEQASRLINPAAFIRRIARNLLIDRARRQERNTLVFFPIDEQRDLSSPPEQCWNLEAADLLRLYESAVDSLPEKTRRIFLMQEVNDGLAHGRYFFMDVRQDGIALYQFDDSELHVPKPKTPEQALTMAREYFEEWFPAAMRKFKLSHDAINQEFSKEAAFLLHQTAEGLYHCILLVVTFYTPHVHNIGFLRTQAERLDLRLVEAWPRERRADQARWEKLKEAYVKARYSKHYRISIEDLNWLAQHIENLGAVVHAIAQERITGLEQAVSG
jgi:HEPN domain-containing protein